MPGSGRDSNRNQRVSTDKSVRASIKTTDNVIHAIKASQASRWGAKRLLSSISSRQTVSPSWTGSRRKNHQIGVLTAWICEGCPHQVRHQNCVTIVSQASCNLKLAISGLSCDDYTFMMRLHLNFETNTTRKSTRTPKTIKNCQKL